MRQDISHDACVWQDIWCRCSCRVTDCLLPGDYLRSFRMPRELTWHISQHQCVRKSLTSPKHTNRHPYRGHDGYNGAYFIFNHRRPGDRGSRVGWHDNYAGGIFWTNGGTGEAGMGGTWRRKLDVVVYSEALEDQTEINSTTYLE